jgi:hypothetical protein
MSSPLRIRLDVLPATPIHGILPTNAAPTSRIFVRLKKRNDTIKGKKHHLTQAHKKSKVARMLSPMLASG